MNWNLKDIPLDELQALRKAITLEVAKRVRQANTIKRTARKR